MKSLRRFVSAVFLAASVVTAPARAAKLVIDTGSPQPGDAVTVTIVPGPGETIKGVTMAAFDTAVVKFYPRADGSARAFVGFPFDRHGGDFPLSARVDLVPPASSSLSTVGGTPAPDVIENLSGVMHALDRIYPTQYITMHNKATASIMDMTQALHDEKVYVQSKMANSYGAPLWQGPWIVPAHGESTSSYGVRRYVNGKWWGQHNGGDIRAGTGTPVLATNSGIVVLSEHLPTLRGNCVVIDHGCNIFSLYLHLSKRFVTPGQRVAKGTCIGLVGATGFVTGPHLHWEIRVGWEPVDPFKFARTGIAF